jgi:hypothetical protein
MSDEMLQVIFGILKKEFATSNPHPGGHEGGHDHDDRYLPEDTASLASALTLDAGRSHIHLQKVLPARGPASLRLFPLVLRRVFMEGRFGQRVIVPLSCSKVP